MSTRGAYGFITAEGETKVAYNRHSSYPRWLGRNIVEFIQNTPRPEMEAIARGLVMVADGDACPTLAQADQLRAVDFVNAQEAQVRRDLGIVDPSPSTWYEWLHDAQGEPQWWRKGLTYLLDDEGFLADSLFCEWAWIINLQERTLEVYKGFNRDPKAPGRYAARQDPKNVSHNANIYGVRLLRTDPLAYLQELNPEQTTQYLQALQEEDS